MGSHSIFKDGVGVIGIRRSLLLFRKSCDYIVGAELHYANQITGPCPSRRSCRGGATTQNKLKCLVERNRERKVIIHQWTQQSGTLETL